LKSKLVILLLILTLISFFSCHIETENSSDKNSQTITKMMWEVSNYIMNRNKGLSFPTYEKQCSAIGNLYGKMKRQDDIAERFYSSEKKKITTGLEKLTNKDFAEFKGMNIGIVANQTSVDKNGKNLIEYAINSKNITLKAIFIPEHGLTGLLDEKFGDGSINDVPLYSLYDETKKPTAEELNGIDFLIFDIQDIGTRYYTFITTMAMCLESSKENNVKIVILDRPNPIGGIKVFGDVTEEKFLGLFTSYYPISMVHGMTIGELALLFNKEYGINSDLTVITMDGWKRRYYYDDLDLPWVNTSPNMRNIESAILYSGLGILETTDLSVGRGTDKPFRYYGAPYIDKEALCEKLNSLKIKGISIKPVEFIPISSTYANKTCYGFEVKITDRRQFDPLRSALIILKTIYEMYPERYNFDRIKFMIGNSYVVNMIKENRDVDDIINSWKERLEEFKGIRKKYLLY